MNIIAIIPARARSKRMPGKNIVEFNGKPLIQHTIEAAKKSKYINKIIISTNDPKVRAIAKDAEIIWRPEELSGDTSKVEDALIHATKELEQQGYKADIIVLLQPTSPLKTTEDIDNTIEAITKKGADSAQTFAKVREHPSLMAVIDEHERPQPLNQDNHLKHSQAFKDIYIKTGAVYVCTYDVLKKTKNIYGDKHLAVITSHERGIDIDYPEDLELALHYAKKK